ncbi:hypothetical protein [Endozoicomonas sp. 8E]|uniref:hypothetical protein n=1 Tax=Endozoicomonas sp. 8E TaxID=3035692 RepID=UPI00293938BE|nr:hypothetical protein [Endozoicomonas sp. 8E]WOG27235.1 hypothetical protein P6910_22220 [Endozoicomonas sp. 8E]
MLPGVFGNEQETSDIRVTANQNPKDYNGMKLVREESKPISGDTGLRKTGSVH